MPKGYKAEFDFSKYKDIEADYLTTDIWSEDGTADDRYALIKVLSRLTLPERRIFLTYTECGTYAETARLFNVNPKTVRNYITNLKKRIIEEYNKELNDIS